MDIEKRISVFRLVRDIPYKVTLTQSLQDYCCSTKSMLLASLLEKEGLRTKQVICTFDWKDTPLPQEIVSLPYQVEETTHQFTQVYIPETSRWVNCDPTWDRLLEKAGFKISEWDGVTDTILAVSPKHILSEQEYSALWVRYSEQSEVDAYYDYHRDFFTAMNRWILDQRYRAEIIE